jgi:hypothetical protein
MYVTVLHGLVHPLHLVCCRVWQVREERKPPLLLQVTELSHVVCHVAVLPRLPLPFHLLCCPVWQPQQPYCITQPTALLPTHCRAGLEYLCCSGQQPHILHLHGTPRTHVLHLSAPAMLAALQCSLQG